MATINLYPLNDLVMVVTLKSIDHTTGVVSPLTAGTVTGFLATSNLPTATAADPSLSVNATYTGASGKWIVAFDGATLSASLLNTLFSVNTPYLIISAPNAIRAYVQLAYQPSRPGTTN